MPKKRHINNLKRLIKKYDTDQKGLAKILGVYQSNLSAWINGKSEIPEYILNAIDDHLAHSKERVEEIKKERL